MWKIYHTTYEFEYITQHDISTQKKKKNCTIIKFVIEKKLYAMKNYI